MFVRHFLVSILVLFNLSGCIVVGAGVASAVGGTYYISGEIKSSYPTSIYHLYKATLYSFKIDNIKVVSVKNTKTDADIEAVIDDDTVKVHIYYNKEGEATLGIRIGTIGDEKRSRELVLAIERYI